ncbi:sensor histidine kinase [Spirochaeta cellobiosiphila]|uniref:sensor histidine kinase n=1 Tax=Spirochaeta cellobiosiphila TaxID=504483 RepID=UPI0003F92D7A|nr:HAMP domain-containing sensor histidine kinase [Spirochaeta cellobiosiphila]
MKKHINATQIILIVTAGILGVFLIVFFSFSLSVGLKLNIVHRNIEINSLVNQIWEAYSLDLEMPDLNEVLTGYGIYKNSDAIITEGSAPDNIYSAYKGIQRLSGDGLYRYIREVGRGPNLSDNPPAPGPMMDRRNMMMSGPRHSRQESTYILVDLDMAKFDRQGFIRNSIMGLFLIVMTILVVMVILMARRILALQRETQNQKSLAQLGEAARTLTHELKNPLGTLKMQQALLRKKLSSEDQEQLVIIGEEIDRMNNLINRVSHFLKNPIGKPEPIQIEDFLEQIVHKRDHKIKTHYHWNRDVSVLFDRDYLRSVFENLIKNALESDPDGSVVEIIGETQKDWILIHLLDEGTGIEEKNREHLFDPFFTTKIQGSGVGLAITKHFVEAQGGEISIKNRPTKGAEAILKLRRYKY